MPYRLARRNLLSCLIILLLLGYALPAAAKVFGNLKFAGTMSEADRKYLGLEKAGPFSLHDIKAPYVLIEITRTT
jgi:hypothetical protein